MFNVTFTQVELPLPKISIYTGHLKKTQKNSYQLNLINRISDFLQVINDTNVKIASLKLNILNKYELTSRLRDMKLRKEVLLTRIKILSLQLDQKAQQKSEINERCAELTNSIFIRGQELAQFYTLNPQTKKKCEAIETANKKKVIELIQLKENLIKRQRWLILGLSKIYPIDVEKRFQTTLSLGIKKIVSQVNLVPTKSVKLKRHFRTTRSRKPSTCTK
jgi:hypothetical protein